MEKLWLFNHDSIIDSILRDPKSSATEALDNEL